MRNKLGDRRDFIKFLGCSSAAWALPLSGGLIAGCATGNKQTKSTPLPFTPMDPSIKDDLVLASGFSYKTLIRWGDIINPKGERFGYNNDFIAFIPFKGKMDHGILWVNHESVQPFFVSGYTGGQKTKSQVIQERKAVGGSLIEVKQDLQGDWNWVKNSKYNRRISGETRIPIISNRPIAGQRTAIGTLANCAGGVTPWNTILTCEENYQDFYGEIVYGKNNKPRRTPSATYLQWEKYFNHSPEHYGWVVEVNPITGEAKKLTALGRFAHESATTNLAKDGRCVVYTADDKKDE